MPPPLDQLRDLKREPPDPLEIERLIAVAAAWLEDAARPQLSREAQFILAYGAAHAVSTAALRKLGYRTEKRFLVFQLLQATLDLGPEVWRVLDKAHEKRNLLEYEGMADIEPQLLKDTLAAAAIVLDAWRKRTGSG